MKINKTTEILEGLIQHIDNFCSQYVTAKNLVIDLKRADIEFDKSTISDFDYSSNFCLKNAKKFGMSSVMLAELIVAELNKSNAYSNEATISTVNSFINIKFSDKVWLSSLQEMLTVSDLENKVKVEPSQIKKIMFEYGDANTHKIPHLGHLSSYIRGQIIFNFLTAQGHFVKNFSYQGDVGLQVAKCIYGFMNLSLDKYPEGVLERALHLQECYVFGSQKYDNEKSVIDNINSQIYQYLNGEDIDIKLIDTYKLTLQWSEDYREYFEKELNIKYDAHIYESEVQATAKQICSKAVSDKQLIEDKGAVIFRAKELDPKLHSRVFINSQGNPTYEAKDLALNAMLISKYPGYLHYVTTASEQIEYFKIISLATKVILKTEEGFLRHIPLGFVSVLGGKMSSRSGNILTGQDVIDYSSKIVSLLLESRRMNAELIATVTKQVSLSALYFVFAKSNIAIDTKFDLDEALRVDGMTGPYLQYTVVRLKSILRRQKDSLDYSISPVESADSNGEVSALFEQSQANLLVPVIRKLNDFETTIESIIYNLELHKLANNLFEIAQAANNFYANYSIDKETVLQKKKYLLQLIATVIAYLEYGLRLLHITIPEQM